MKIFSRPARLLPLLFLLFIGDISASAHVFFVNLLAEYGTSVSETAVLAEDSRLQEQFIKVFDWLDTVERNQFLTICQPLFQSKPIVLERFKQCADDLVAFSQQVEDFALRSALALFEETVRKIGKGNRTWSDRWKDLNKGYLACGVAVASAAVIATVLATKDSRKSGAIPASGDTALKAATTDLFDGIYQRIQEKHSLLFYSSAKDLKKVFATVGIQNPSREDLRTLNRYARLIIAAKGANSGQPKKLDQKLIAMMNAVYKEQKTKWDGIKFFGQEEIGFREILLFKKPFGQEKDLMIGLEEILLSERGHCLKEGRSDYLLNGSYYSDVAYQAMIMKYEDLLRPDMKEIEGDVSQLRQEIRANIEKRKKVGAFYKEMQKYLPLFELMYVYDKVLYHHDKAQNNPLYRDAIVKLFKFKNEAEFTGFMSEKYKSDLDINKVLEDLLSRTGDSTVSVSSLSLRGYYAVKLLFYYLSGKDGYFNGYYETFVRSCCNDVGLSLETQGVLSLFNKKREQFFSSMNPWNRGELQVCVDVLDRLKKFDWKYRDVIAAAEKIQNEKMKQFAKRHIMQGCMSRVKGGFVEKMNQLNGLARRIVAGEIKADDFSINKLVNCDPLRISLLTDKERVHYMLIAAGVENVNKEHIFETRLRLSGMEENDKAWLAERGVVYEEDKNYKELLSDRAQYEKVFLQYLEDHSSLVNNTELNAIQKIVAQIQSANYSDSSRFKKILDSLDSCLPTLQTEWPYLLGQALRREISRMQAKVVKWRKLKDDFSSGTFSFEDRAIVDKHNLVYDVIGNIGTLVESSNLNYLLPLFVDISDVDYQRLKDRAQAYLDRKDGVPLVRDGEKASLLMMLIDDQFKNNMCPRG